MFTDRNDYSRGDVPELLLRRGDHRVGGGGTRRSLRGEDLENLLVDKDGVAYDPNSLSWRYLGLYVDCDDQDNNGSGSRDDGNGNDDGGGGGGGSYCQRKLLWAAYLDKRYKQYSGNGIGDYKLYDVSSGGYDSTSCDGYGSSRCAKLDCHEPSTNFELLGVLRETKGMYDWTEQLFKHEGVCIWNDDGVYETMKTWMEKWPRECQALDVTDNRGNAIYLDIKPLPGGDMTLAIYKDSICSKVSSNMDFAAYTVKLYKSMGYSSQTGYDVAQTYKEAIDTWNERMNVFKVCQPCVAYNLYSGRDGKEHGRFLGGNQGDGEERQFYNCYDDAGYTNVNQCYKFGSKTELEVSDEYDLSTASSQGTILRIKANNGRVYGKGGYKASGMSLSLGKTLFPAVAIVFLAFTALLFRRIVIRRRQQRSRLRRKLWRRKSSSEGGGGGGTGRKRGSKKNKKGRTGTGTGGGKAAKSTKRGGGVEDDDRGTAAWDEEIADSPLSVAGEDAMIARHHATAGTYVPPPPSREGEWDEKKGRGGVRQSSHGKVGIEDDAEADYAAMNRRGGRRGRSSSWDRSSSRGRRPAPNHKSEL